MFFRINARFPSPKTIFIGFFSALALAALPARAHDPVTPPVPKEQTAPQWPQGQAEAHDVIVPLIVTVNPDGRVAAVEVEASVSPAFDAEALRAAATWSFEPARRKDVPVSARIRMIARFSAASSARAAPATNKMTPIADTPSPAPKKPDQPVTVVVRAAPPPRSVSDIEKKRDVLAAAPARTGSDLLRTLAGVFVTQHSGQGKAHQIFLRGYDAAHGQDLEIWVAGAPVNEVSHIHGQGYADLHFIMPEIVQSVRATPGPYAPHQGDFAIAGSLGFDLGLADPGFSTSATAGSFGEKRFFLAYRPNSASDESFVAMEAQSTDGFGPSRAAERASAVAQWSFPLGTSANLRLMASTYAARFSSAGVLIRDDIESGRVDRFSTYDPNQGGQSTRTQIVASIHNTTNDETNVRFSFTPFFIARGLSLRSNYTGFLSDPAEGDSQQQTNDVYTFGFSGHYTRALRIFSDQDSITAGVYGRRDDIEQTQRQISSITNETTTTYTDADIRATNVAGFLDASIRPVRRVVLRGGFRVDALSYAMTDGATSNVSRASMGVRVGGKATVDVAITSGLHAIASYGDGFRSPQARSLEDGQTLPITTARAFEGGVRYEDGKTLQAIASVFHSSLSDDLIFEETTARNESAPATARTGASIDFTLRPRPWFTHSGSLTYTYARFVASNGGIYAGSLVPYAPQLVLRSDIAATPRLAHFWGRDLLGRAGIGLSYLGFRPLPYGEFGRDIFLADATLGLRFSEIEFEVDIFNLLDTRWYDGQFTYASNFTPGANPSLLPKQHVTAGAPRTVLGALTLHL